MSRDHVLRWLERGLLTTGVAQSAISNQQSAISWW
jgi:hypothetical protein